MARKSPVRLTPRSTGTVISAITLSLFDQMTSAATPPIITVLRIAFTNSIKLLTEKIRPSPLIGLIRSNLGIHALVLNIQPLNNIGAKNATTSSKNNKGAIEIKPSTVR